MLRIHRGHGGWAVESRAIAWRIEFATLVLALALAGCSSKQPPAAGAGAPGSNAGGLGQEGVGGAGGSSLSQFQKGKLGSGEQGPLSDIHFDYNDFTVRPQDSEILHSNADWLQKNPGSHVQIEGHCDERGSEEYNIALGAKRAQAAKEYLQTLGIAADRMSTISYGKELPLCTEHTEDCWAENRRDHFALTE
ncbi:MAG TPA: peptidoglycan-associated lipoprotein Pal [Candidatus Binataceae bacterium]|nr:peptidoglycan-associated lipoprotein Pal [Candidatus Binataceae bacterium]